MTPLEIIARKRDGGEIAPADLRELVLAFGRGEVPDYQMAAFLMAGYLRGFSEAEAWALTAAMTSSGRLLDLSGLRGPTVDKHSTGGVADGTTLVVGPLAAACGLQVVKLSGRGLGHTGGTLDKLESIPGLRTALSTRELLEQVERIGVAVAAQTSDLVPADGAMYALRDATGTVGNVALIAASVMSKKLAAGASCVLLDVKTGSGAFMKDLASANELARLCVAIGNDAGRRTMAVVSDMSQPLGELVGNALEVREGVEILRGERRGRVRELCLSLTAWLLVLAGRAADHADGSAQARTALEAGLGLEKLRAMIAAQGGDQRVVDDLTLLPAAPLVAEVPAPASATLAAVDAEAVGLVAAALGAGRSRKDDAVDPAVGLELWTKIGDRVEARAPVGRVFAREAGAAATAAHDLLAALTWADGPVAAPPLVHAVVGGKG